MPNIDIHKYLTSIIAVQVFFFNFQKSKINENKSYRPHVLLFDEFYTELYQYEKAITWLLEAETIIFMGTSNSVGFTSGALQMGISNGKQVIVVDPNPSPSFKYPQVEIFEELASVFCERFFSNL